MVFQKKKKKSRKKYIGKELDPRVEKQSKQRTDDLYGCFVLLSLVNVFLCLVNFRDHLQHVEAGLLPSSARSSLLPCPLLPPAPPAPSFLGSFLAA